MAGNELQIEPSTLDAPEALPLCAALDAESQARYPFDLSRHFRVSPEEFAAERGAFLLARIDGKAVGCGGVRLLDPETAELKRMYVAPSARGKGIARALLAALEHEARVRGATQIILETGNKQVEALALYRREGYTDIPRYEPYVDATHSVCLAKQLVV